MAWSLSAGVVQGSTDPKMRGGSEASVAEYIVLPIALRRNLGLSASVSEVKVQCFRHRAWGSTQPVNRRRHGLTSQGWEDNCKTIDHFSTYIQYTGVL